MKRQFGQFEDGRLSMAANDTPLTDVLQRNGMASMRIGNDGGIRTLNVDGDEVPVGGGAAAGIDFSLLHNVLIVDQQSFTSATPGWGVKTFATLEAAAGVAAGGSYLIICYGVISVSIGVTFTDADLYLAPNCDIQNGVQTIYLDGSCSISGFGVVSGDVKCVAAGAQLTVNGVTIGGTLQVGESGGVAISLINANVTAMWIIDVVNLDLSASTLGSLLVFVSDFTFSAVNSSFVSLTDADLDNPLNHSNTLDGATYRPVVLIADLPAAGDNAGATAQTSDGGTGGIPAMVWSDGATWKVVVE